MRRFSAGLAVVLLASVLALSPAAAQVPWICDGLEATIVGTPGDDDIEGTDGVDVIFAREGDDTIHALDGDDVVCAGKGNDVVFGGGGFDIIFGAQGDDRLYSAAGRGLNDRVDTRGARMFGGAGNDTIHGSNRWDRMQGGPGDDRLFGHEGRDWMRGGPQNDVLDGGAGIDDVQAANGRDRIVVGTSDIVRGGSGIDVCEVFNGQPQTLISCSRAPWPASLVVDQRGSDVVRVFRELDGALEYLRQAPHLTDSARFAEGLGGARDLQFMADRGFVAEARRPQDTRSLEVSVQGWAGPDYVQLYVVERRNEAGRRILDEFGAERWRDRGWEEPTRHWIVGMRRTNGVWRISDRTTALPRESRASSNGFFTPRTIPSVSPNETIYQAGSWPRAGGGRLNFVLRGYVAANGDHCIEFRLGAVRHVNCIDRAEAGLVQSQSRVQYLVGVLREQWGYVLGFGPNFETGGFRPFQVTARSSSISGSSARPDSFGNIRMFATVKQSWFHEVTVSNGQNGPAVGTSTHAGVWMCGEWSAGGGPDGMFSTAKYSERSSLRKPTRAELEQYILQHVDAAYPAPKVQIVRRAPANTGVFTSVPGNPSWYQLKIRDFSNDHAGVTRTWALALGRDAGGWYIGDSHFRQDCAA